jgi:hypothetical protein
LWWVEAIKIKASWMPVILANRDQEDQVRRQLEQIVCEILLQKRTGEVAQGVGPQYKPQYRKKIATTTTKNCLQFQWAVPIPTTTT